MGIINRGTYTTTIIAGKYKFKKIKIPPLPTTRPTKNIIRESFFNTSSYALEGSFFIETFAGSGSMGLEALSRGALFCYFLEKNKICVDILMQNCKNIAPKDTHIIRGDTFEIFYSLIEKLLTFNKRCIFYFDPPFKISSIEDACLQTSKLIEKIPSKITKLICIEHAYDRKISSKIGNFDKFKSSRFGKTSMSYFR